MKNYLNFETDIKNLEEELDKLKDPYNQEGLSEVDTSRISKVEEEIKYKTPPTNVDFITEFMSWGNPLKQVFVVSVLYEHAQKLFNMSKEQIEEADKNSPFVNMYAWQEVAGLYLEAYNEFYASPVRTNQ